MMILRECPKCGKTTKLTVSEEAWAKHREGAPASQAFPDMTMDERTTLIFGVCSECINKNKARWKD